MHVIPNEGTAMVLLGADMVPLLDTFIRLDARSIFKKLVLALLETSSCKVVKPAFTSCRCSTSSLCRRFSSPIVDCTRLPLHLLLLAANAQHGIVRKLVQRIINRT